MGDFGVIPGMLGAFIFTLVFRALFPHVFQVVNPDYPAGVKIAIWTFLFGFPLSVIFGAVGRKKIVALFWSVTVFWPIIALLLLQEYVVPPFWMRGYDTAARWLSLLGIWMLGSWTVMWFLTKMRVEVRFDWLANLLDRMLGRK